MGSIILSIHSLVAPAALGQGDGNLAANPSQRLLWPSNIHWQPYISFTCTAGKVGEVFWTKNTMSERLIRVGIVLSTLWFSDNLLYLALPPEPLPPWQSIPVERNAKISKWHSYYLKWILAQFLPSRDPMMSTFSFYKENIRKMYLIISSLWLWPFITKSQMLLFASNATKLDYGWLYPNYQFHCICTALYR